MKACCGDSVWWTLSPQQNKEHPLLKWVLGTDRDQDSPKKRILSLVGELTRKGLKRTRG